MFGDDNVWIDALLATSAISTLPNILLFLVPTRLVVGNDKSPNSLNMQNIFLCFASAGLLGDIFLHILPHLLGTHNHSHGADNNGHSHSHNHDHNHVVEHGHEHVHGHEEHGRELHSEGGLLLHGRDGINGNGNDGDDLLLFGMEKGMAIQLFVVLGFLLFLLAEKLANQHLGGEHSHSHSHNGDNANSCENSDSGTTGSSKRSSNISNTTGGKALSLRSGRSVKKESTPVFHDTTVTSVSPSFFSKLSRTLKASGWLNLLADSMHNFTDGIAIGTTFASSAGGGSPGSGSGIALATFLSVICHEVPHEIGDFTILIRNGLSKNDAIAAQFLTAIAAILGTVVGLVSQFHSSVQDLFLALTAGGFLYLSTVTMLPAVVAEKSSSKQIVCECIAFVAGVCMMVAIALLE